MEVVESFEDLDDVARDESFGQIAERLEGLLERAVLDEPVKMEGEHYADDVDPALLTRGRC